MRYSESTLTTNAHLLLMHIYSKGTLTLRITYSEGTLWVPLRGGVVTVIMHGKVLSVIGLSKDKEFEYLLPFFDNQLWLVRQPCSVKKIASRVFCGRFWDGIALTVFHKFASHHDTASQTYPESEGSFTLTD